MSRAIDPDDHRWYQRAVFYEVLVRGFYDANGDGTGDLRGLTEKLDYLEWLGVDCLWLLPFYQSPLRDGGYDISDFFIVLPEYGDVDDAARLVEEAHRRGIRVIADMVMNHTSDQHPWFQEIAAGPDQPEGRLVRLERRRPALAARPASSSSTPRRRTGPGTPSASSTTGTASSTISPTSTTTTPRSPRRCSTSSASGSTSASTASGSTPCPYLFERDGTNGENLPETHEYLRRLRKEVDDEFPGKVLLAEANQWPADVVDYFGDGDECHMCFHFPLMPRMFMAVRREQRYPITEILAQTPDIPDGCQWGIFLRNHDELTLEMVTDEERDYMYAEYAKDPRMRRNVGIGRRLLPAPRQRPPRRRAVPRHVVRRCRAARSSTTATRSGWATTSTSATATACARRCSGRPTATAASPGPTSPGSTCRR